MKKFLLLLCIHLVAMAGMAQTSTDTYTVKKSDGTSQSFKIVEFPKIAFDSSTTFGNYMTGFEDFGALNTWNVDDVSSIIFDVFHESDGSDVSLADKAASDATKRLFKYMKANYGSRMFSSVMANVNWNHTIADQIYTTTGKYPAFNCYDFIHIYVPENNWINYEDITPVTEWADAGGLVSLMWHFNVPKTETTTIGTDGSGVTCTPSETTFRATNALTSGTWENEWFYEQMDKVISVLLKLQDAGIVALWRPFHEAAGNAYAKNFAGTAWFWWGYDGAEIYKKLWQTMFDYFQQKGVHNLIWVWTAQNYNGDSTAYDNDNAYYPGSDYVDIVARDLYGYTAEQCKTEFSQLASLYSDKMITLGECGQNNGTQMGALADIWNGGAEWLSFMPWYGESLPSDEWLKAAMTQQFVITRDEVNVNSTFVHEAAVDAVKNLGLGYSLGNTLDAYSANLANHQDNTSVYETCWGQPVTKDTLMTFLKKEGFNTVRVPVTWYPHIDDNGNVDESWMNRVQEVVDYVINAGMYCILNLHHDTAEDNNSGHVWVKADTDTYTASKAKYEALWQNIAMHFADYDHHLLFEGYNEMLDAGENWNNPSDESSYTALNNFAQSFVNAVRSTGGNNAKRNLIVSLYAASPNQQTVDNFKIPTDETSGHLIVEAHTYAPWDWFAQKGAWDSSCSSEIASTFTLLNTAFANKGIPYIIGEYGTHGTTSVSKNSTASQIQAAADQAADMTKQAKANNSAAFYWMSIIEGTDRDVPQWTLPTVVKAMVDAYNQE